MKKPGGKIFGELSLSRCEELFFGSFLIKGNEEDILGVEQIPHIINAAGLCICLDGYAEIMVESQNYFLQKGDMCVVLPRTILHATKKSPDFRGYTCVCTPEFLFSINMPSSMPLYLFVKDNPCISLTEKEQKGLIRMCNFLEEHNRRKDHLCREEISKLLASAIVYEVVNIYKKGKVLEQQPFTRKSNFFAKFIKLLTENYTRYRNVQFYADKLCITSRYLSAICKEITGMTATECIDNHIMINIRLLLATTEMSVLQISEKLNFPNPSFFTQYFKKREGITPKVYRGKNVHQ